MNLVCLGLNHLTAPVELRERFAVLPSKWPEAVQEFQQKTGTEGCVLLSTCNRFEFYYQQEKEKDGNKAVRQFLENHFQAPAGQHFYEKYNEEVAFHLCRVVSGLDSMVLGETEIFGQVKKAYESALGAKVTTRALNKMFQRAFSVGKLVRTQTKIQQGQTSVGSVAVDLAEKIFGSLKESKVVLVGAGEMSRATAQSLLSRGAKSIFIANRSYDKAQKLATEMQGTVVNFDQWDEVLNEVDIVISSTGAPHFVLHRKQVEKSRRARKYRPLFLIDIAVPRDIEPTVGEIEEAYLYDIDTLQGLAKVARERREREIKHCEALISKELKGLKSIIG